MPLPRFHRLSAEQQAHIIATARAHIAEHGNAASYNQIIAEAGISKASAYHYFDGKADLFGEVRRTLDSELAALLGPWKHARTSDAFWTRLRAESARLRAHFAANEADLRVLAATSDPGDAAVFDSWFGALLDNGVELGIVRADVDRSLVRDATRALFSVFDRRAIAALQRSDFSEDRDEPEGAWELLRALWMPPVTRRGAR